MSGCMLCPRLCGVDRMSGELGFCGEGSMPRVARADLHMFEEPPISGTRGSGTVFFAGCSMRCVFCQNGAISRGGETWREVSAKELCDIFFELEGKGAHNINLVTPTHFSDTVREALVLAKPRLGIPVIYNTSGYERVEVLRSLEGLVDIYLPDFKYASEELALRYSSAADYPQVALTAICEMYRQRGRYIYDGEGMLASGVVVRHLVLPSHRRDSMEALSLLAGALPVRDILLSLMSQYTPEFAVECSYRELHRRVTTFEYRTVLAHAEALGFDGFMQDISSAVSAFTPDFKE